MGDRAGIGASRPVAQKVLGTPRTEGARALTRRGTFSSGHLKSGPVQPQGAPPPTSANPKLRQTPWRDRPKEHRSLVGSRNATRRDVRGARCTRTSPGAPRPHDDSEVTSWDVGARGLGGPLGSTAVWSPEWLILAFPMSRKCRQHAMSTPEGLWPVGPQAVGRCPPPASTAEPRSLFGPSPDYSRGRGVVPSGVRLGDASNHRDYQPSLYLTYRAEAPRAEVRARPRRPRHVLTFGADLRRRGVGGSRSPSGAAIGLCPLSLRSQGLRPVPRARPSHVQPFPLPTSKLRPERRP